MCRGECGAAPWVLEREGSLSQRPSKMGCEEWRGEGAVAGSGFVPAVTGQRVSRRCQETMANPQGSAALAAAAPELCGEVGKNLLAFGGYTRTG